MNRLSVAEWLRLGSEFSNWLEGSTHWSCDRPSWLVLLHVRSLHLHARIVLNIRDDTACLSCSPSDFNLADNDSAFLIPIYIAHHQPLQVIHVLINRRIKLPWHLFKLTIYFPSNSFVLTLLPLEGRADEAPLASVKRVCLLSCTFSFSLLYCLLLRPQVMSLYKFNIIDLHILPRCSLWIIVQEFYLKRQKRSLRWGW